MNLSNEALVEYSTLSSELDALKSARRSKDNVQSFREKWLRLTELKGLDEKACGYVVDCAALKSYGPLFEYLCSAVKADGVGIPSVLVNGLVLDGRDETQAQLLFSIFALAAIRGNDCISITQWVVKTIVKARFVRSVATERLGEVLRAGVGKVAKRGDDLLAAGGASLLSAKEVDDLQAVLAPALKSLELNGRAQNTALVLDVLKSWFDTSDSVRDHCVRKGQLGVEPEQSEVLSCPVELEQAECSRETEGEKQGITRIEQDVDATHFDSSVVVGMNSDEEKPVFANDGESFCTGAHDSFESALQGLADIYREHDICLKSALQKTSSLEAELNALAADAELLDAELQKKSSELLEKLEELSQKENAICLLKDSLDDSKNRCAGLEEKLIGANSMIDELRNRLAEEGELLQELEARNSSLENEKIELNGRILDMAAEIESNEQMIEILDGASKKHANEEIVRLARSLRTYYDDYASCLDDEMSVDLGENMRIQLGEVFKTLQKSGVEL